MKICFFHSTLKILFSKDDMHDVSHLTISDQFRKNVENVHLRISENSQ